MKYLWRQLSLLKQLHWVTWSAMLLAAVPLVLIMVPGEEVWDSGNENSAWQESLQDLRKSTSDLTPHFPDFFFLDVDLYEHGWPIPYMARGVIREGVPPQHGFITDSYKGIGWIYVEPWPFFADKRIIRWWALAVDLAISLTILGIVGAVIEWRIRSGAGRWRFRLFDAFLITAVLAIFLAPFAYHAHVQRMEASLLSLSFEENGIEVSYEYHGPVWLRKLVGNKFFLQSMFHIDAITINPSENWWEEFAQLEKCPYLKSVTVNHWLPLGAIPILKRNHHLNHLELPDLAISDSLLKYQDSMKQPFQAEHVWQLEPLELTSITINGTGYEARHVSQLAELPDTRTIFLAYTTFSNNTLQTLRRQHPDVEFVLIRRDTGRPLPSTAPQIDLPDARPDTQQKSGPRETLSGRFVVLCC